MSKELSPGELNKLVESSIKQLKTFIDELRKDNSNKTNAKRAMLLAYWILDYIKMIRSEKTFNPRKLLRYERGDILSVDFGFRIGSELGGRHFAIVLDNHNSQNSSVVTVAPLRSLKEGYKESCFTHLLNKGIYELQQEKFTSIVASCQKSLTELMSYKERSLSEEEALTFSNKVHSINKRIKEAKKLNEALTNLKLGSIVDLGQIITVSKQRILNPKFPSDTLNKIKVTPKDLDEISNKLSYLYLYKPNKKDLITPFIDGLK